MRDNMIRYYTLEYFEPVNGHYRYLYRIPENHPGFITTDAPSDAMKWKTEKEAQEYLDEHGFKAAFHVQAMLTDDEHILDN